MRVHVGREIIWSQVIGIAHMCVRVTVRVNNIKYIQRRSSVLDFKITLLNLGALSADTLSSAQTEMKV